MEIAITGMKYAVLDDVLNRLVTKKVSITDVERFEDGFADIQFNIPNGFVRRVDDMAIIGNKDAEYLLTLRKDQYYTIILV